jgi:hypothetical protein
MTNVLQVMNRLLAVTGAALLITLIVVLSVPVAKCRFTNLYLARNSR